MGLVGDPDARPGIVLGSHLDSVADGGAFDGPLGVVSALAALDALRDNGFTPRMPLGIANFADEEGDGSASPAPGRGSSPGPCHRTGPAA